MCEAYFSLFFGGNPQPQAVALSSQSFASRVEIAGVLRVSLARTRTYLLFAPFQQSRSYQQRTANLLLILTKLVRSKFPSTSAQGVAGGYLFQVGVKEVENHTLRHTIHIFVFDICSLNFFSCSHLYIVRGLVNLPVHLPVNECPVV